MSKKLDIDFYKKSTKHTFKKFQEELEENSLLTTDEIKEWLEAIYYAVANEYGG